MLKLIITSALTLLVAALPLLLPLLSGRRRELKLIADEVEVLGKIPDGTPGRESMQTAVQRSMDRYERRTHPDVLSERQQRRLAITLVVLMFLYIGGLICAFTASDWDVSNRTENIIRWSGLTIGIGSGVILMFTLVARMARTASSPAELILSAVEGAFTGPVFSLSEALLDSSMRIAHRITRRARSDGKEVPKEEDK